MKTHGRRRGGTSGTGLGPRSVRPTLGRLTAAFEIRWCMPCYGVGKSWSNDLGELGWPEWYSDEFRRLSKRAGVPRIVLHEGRHTALRLTEKAGVPISIISKWAGHYDTAFTYSTYVHAAPTTYGQAPRRWASSTG